MPTVTTTQTVKVQLAPKLLTQVRQALQTYAELTTKVKELKRLAAGELADIEALFEKGKAAEALDNGTSVDDYKLKVVRGYSSTLDKKFLMDEFGVTADMLTQATTTKPKKPYLKITVPGEQEE